MSVDLGSLEARTAEAVASLREIQPAQMKATLDAAAAEERASHAYQNRTGDAEASTQAGPLQSTGDVVFCILEMGVDYAVFLDVRGLTGIRDAAEGAAEELGYYFEGERDRLADL